MAFAPVVRGQNKLEVLNEGDSAEILMIGAIGKSWYDDSGLTEKEFRDALASIPYGKPITLKINSEGGSVQEGLGIYNAIKERRSEITAKITGYALSIASVFPLGASRVVSPKSSIWMIHCAWSWAQGNAEDMRKQAEMLDKHDAALIDIYAAETGKSKAELRAAMEKETWITGADAVAFGLADESDIDGDAQASYRPLAQNYLDRCKNLSPEILNALRPTARVLEANGNGVTQNQTEGLITPAASAISAPCGAENQTKPAAAQAGGNTNTNTPMPENTIPAAAASTTAPDALATVQAQLASERKARITAEVTRRAENKIKNDQLATVIDMAMQDEAKAYAFIESLTVTATGNAPVGHSSGITLGAETPLENIKKLGGAKARFAGLKKDWEGLIKDAQARDARASRGGAVAGNSYSSSLTTQYLLDGAVTQLQNRLAMLKAFTRDFSTDAYKPLATAQLKFVTGGSTTLTNPTNFESGDSTVTNVAIAVNHISQPFHVTDSELNSGLRMENLVNVNSKALATKLGQVVTALITSGNFGSPAPIVASVANFGYSTLQTAWGELAKATTKNAILDGSYMAKLLNVPTYYQPVGDIEVSSAIKAFGWDLIALQTDWSQAGANVLGFACDPQAIGVVAGLPLAPQAASSSVLSVSTETIPDIDLTIATYRWLSLATRTEWVSYDVMFGASVLDSTAGVVISKS